MNWETILFLGDSLTVGARSYLGYPEYTGDLLTQKLSKDWNVVNHATNGFTAIDLSRSVSNNYASLAAQNPLISVVLIGTNDAKIGTSEEAFRIALEQLIIKAKLMTLHKKVLLLQIPDLAAGVSYPYTVGMNKNIAVYNQIIEKMAVKHQVKTLSIALNPEHFYDGVHFNEAGTITYARSLADFILKERGMQ